MMAVTALIAIPTLVALEVVLIGENRVKSNKNWICLATALNFVIAMLIANAAPAAYAQIVSGMHSKRWIISSTILSGLCCLLQLWFFWVVLGGPMFLSLVTSLMSQESVTITLA